MQLDMYSVATTGARDVGFALASEDGELVSVLIRVDDDSIGLTLSEFFAVVERVDEFMEE